MHLVMIKLWRLSLANKGVTEQAQDDHGSICKMIQRAQK